MMMLMLSMMVMMMMMLLLLLLVMLLLLLLSQCFQISKSRYCPYVYANLSFSQRGPVSDSLCLSHNYKAAAALCVYPLLFLILLYATHRHRHTVNKLKIPIFSFSIEEFHE